MPEDTLDEMMRDYAESAVELARDFKVTLDYSEGSLQELERILGQLHRERQGMFSSHSSKTELNGEATAAAASLGAGAKTEQGEKTGQARSLQEGAEEVEEQMVMMCKLWGGYLGEVVRRRWGGEWAMETYPGAGFATLTLNVRGAKLFPSMKIYRRLTEGEQEDVWSFYQRVKGKLE
jgi:hypothetical protein